MTVANDLKALIFEVATPGWGWIGLAASARGLRLLTLPAPSYDAALHRVRLCCPDAPLAPDDPFLLDVADQVQAYLAGTRREFTVALDLVGHTAFELTVWAAATRIPYGQTRTYAWLADQVGRGADAAQAVGAVLGANPVPITVPCHRVIGSDGSLHGYAGGLDMKARLLALESGQMMLNWPA
jgi:O-6-methylguanine DNA methyltransferase